MKKIKVFNVITFILISVSCSINNKTTLTKEGEQGTYQSVSKIDSLGYTTIGISSYTFYSDERYVTTIPYKFKKEEKGHIRTFEYVLFDQSKSENVVFIQNLEIDSSILTVSRKTLKEEPNIDVDSIKFSLKDRVKIKIDSTDWVVDKFNANYKDECITIYFNDSIGFIKGYSLEAISLWTHFFNGEVNFLTQDEKFIIKAIRENFLIKEGFHERCDNTKTLYLNGKKIK